MDIREIPISKLNPAKYNPRKDLGPDDPEYIQLEKSIKEFGNVDPIIWNEKTGNIVGGHQRFKVLSADLKPKDKLKVSVVKLSERKEKMLNIALNKISGDWDMVRLKDLIDEINVDEFDIGVLGFEKAELTDLFDYRISNEKDETGGKLGDYTYTIVVECDNEAHQAQLISDLEKMELKCRPLIS